MQSAPSGLQTALSFPSTDEQFVLLPLTVQTKSSYPSQLPCVSDAVPHTGGSKTSL